MSKKTGIPSERHEEIGPELARMRDRLLKLTVELKNAYPKGSPGYRGAARLNSAVTALDRARSDLEDAMLTEYPYGSLAVYYPPPEIRTRIG